MVKAKRSLIAALIAVIWAVTAVLFLIPNVSAADVQQLDISSGDVNITTAGDYTISGTSSTSKITIDCTGTVNLTFNSVNITAAYQGIVMDIKKAAVNLELNGSNILQANQDSAVYPAVKLSDGAELHIYDKNNNGSIKIHGTSNYYGGGAAVSGGSLYIHGGDVSLVGGNKIQGDYGKSFDGKVLNISGGSLSFAGGLINSTESGAIAVSSSLTVGSGATLSIPKNGSVDIANGATFTNQGTVVNNGTVNNNGTYSGTGSITGSGSSTGIVGTAFTISGNNLIYGTDYTYPADTGVLTILSSKEMTISGTTTKDTIVVAKNVSTNIILAGVNIDVSGTEDACAFKIEDNSTGNVTITLADGSTNILKSGKNCAGLQKNGTVGSIEIKGTGSLEVTGGQFGAGIGGGASGSGSNITINGGTVTATGGQWGAGIGGGDSGNGSDITISGGSVKATAGANVYNAIGGGGDGNGAVIPTDGSGKNVYLAVIDNPNDEDVYIDGKLYSPKNHKAADSSDGKLYAYLTGKNRTVRVGNDEIDYLFSGSSLDVLATDLTISGDNLIYGTDYTYPASTGVLTILSDKKVTISGTTVTDTIVVAKDKNADITLDGVDIDVSTTPQACAFQIEDDSTGNITITLADGSDNILKSGNYCAGLQKNGSGTDIGKLTVSGTGKLIANGGDYAAGIGGGNCGSGSNITISGGTITANGGVDGAGIGGGDSGSGSNITISGGTVIATGRYCGSGIGGGSEGSGSNIIISGGTVTAAGGTDSNWGGAGIGGGWKGDGDIIISGGSVKAIAGSNANAIGGGNGKGAVIPTNGSGKNVYLIELPAAANTLTIDGKAYPTNHGTDGKVYVYLTEGKHTFVTDGNSETKSYGKNSDNKLEEIGTAFTVTGDNLIYGTDYTYPASTGVLTILSDKKVTISGSTTKDTIVVGQNKNADITLDGVNIDVSTIYYACAFKIEDDSTGNVTITLADGSTNTLKSGEKCAGLQKNGDNGKLTIQGNGELTVTGGKYAAGIGGNDSSNGSHITISGGIITTNGGSDGAGIGGGWGFPSGGCGSDIIISGGSVKATAGSNADAIGGGPFGSGSVIPTNGTEKVYLLELDNPNGKAITINGKTYPTSHNGEKKIYAYLPAKTAADPNTVTVGESASKYYYDTANSKWYGVADIPDADDTEFTYNGKEQTYAIPESTLYTIDGSKQKTPGDYTVTVALTDKVNSTWSDGTTEDREYTFTIAKAEPTITVTAKPTSDIAGKTITVTASAVNPENTALDDIPDIVLTYRIGDGAEIPFTGSFVIPEGTAIGTVITVKAVTAEDSNYKSSEAETKVNVSDCTHDDVNAKWESDSTGHWHICNYCSENVDFAAHTFGDWKITVPATEAADGKKEHSCTVCGYTEEEAVKYTAAAKAAEEAEKVLDDITADNDTTADDIISKINEAVDDDVTFEVTTFEKIPATEDSEGSITVVITITDSDGNTETVEKTFVIGKLPESDKPQTVYYPISINGNVTADRTSAKAGDTVNVSTSFGYDIIVTSNGRQIARITEKGSFVMPNGSVHITVVQNDTLAMMSNAWDHAYVYSYDSDMNRIKINSDTKRGIVIIDLGADYACRKFTIYSGRKNTSKEIISGKLDENGKYIFTSDDGRNYTLVVK